MIYFYRMWWISRVRATIRKEYIFLHSTIDWIPLQVVMQSNNIVIFWIRKENNLKLQGMLVYHSRFFNSWPMYHKKIFIKVILWIDSLKIKKILSYNKFFIIKVEMLSILPCCSVLYYLNIKITIKLNSNMAISDP
jgi:hypothetical protein